MAIDAGRRRSRVVRHIQHCIADMDSECLLLLKGTAHPELVMVTDDLIPGDLLIQPLGQEGHLVIDAAFPGMSTGTGVDHTTIHHIDKPA